MSLEKWEEYGWLRAKPTSYNEIQNLLVIVNRDMEDAQGEVSTDWQFGIAYNAALKLCTILLRASGYRAASGDHHNKTIMTLPEILGHDWREDAEYLNSCRMKRNTLEYDYAGCATEGDVMELRTFLDRFRDAVLSWLDANHPEFK